MLLALLKLGFRLEDVLQMSEAELEGWLRAAGLLKPTKTYVVRNKSKKRK